MQRHPKLSRILSFRSMLRPLCHTLDNVQVREGIPSARTNFPIWEKLLRGNACFPRCVPEPSISLHGDRCPPGAAGGPCAPGRFPELPRNDEEPLHAEADGHQANRSRAFAPGIHIFRLVWLHPIKANPAVVGVLGLHCDRDIVKPTQEIDAALLFNLATHDLPAGVPNGEKFGRHLADNALAGGLELASFSSSSKGRPRLAYVFHRLLIGLPPKRGQRPGRPPAPGSNRG